MVRFVFPQLKRQLLLHDRFASNHYVYNESEQQSRRRLAGTIASITFITATGAMVAFELYDSAAIHSAHLTVTRRC